MKYAIYLETSFISYLTGRLSNNIMVASRQISTQNWWRKRRQYFDLYISEAVELEAQSGNKEAANKRNEIIKDLPLLNINPEILELAQAFIQKGSLPEKAAVDAVHISVATFHKMNYLLTWNCKHIANAEIQKKLRKITRNLGYELPVICTPEELMGR